MITIRAKTNRLYRKSLTSLMMTGHVQGSNQFHSLLNIYFSWQLPIISIYTMYIFTFNDRQIKSQLQLALYCPK